MIKHHPKQAMLLDYCKGELPASLSAAISIHNQMCPHCQALVEQLTHNEADSVFESTDNSPGLYDNHLSNDSLMAQMLDDITDDDSFAVLSLQTQQTLTVRDQTFLLPFALANMAIEPFSNIGKLSSAKIELDEGPLHCKLLYLAPGAEIAHHTHKGFELTLLLDGHFSDEMGQYGPGDFILLDNQHQHTPTTENGCLCLTVVSDALHFTKGLSRLLNPIGRFIY